MTVVAELVEDLMGDVYHSHYRGENYFLSTRDQADLGIKRKKSEMQIMGEGCRAQVPEMTRGGVLSDHNADARVTEELLR